MAGGEERLIPPLQAPDRQTRGRSRPGRLRLVDRVLVEGCSAVLERRDGEWAQAVVVDVGLGAEPWTTLELCQVLAPLGLAVVGVDNDPERVAAALRLAPALDVRLGGFDLALAERVRVIRALNLLRGYPAGERDEARRRLSGGLLDGGLLLEGSTCRTGRTVGMTLHTRAGRELVFDGAAFATDFSMGFAPRMFRGPAPLGTRQLLDRWQAAWEETERGLTPAERFVASAAAVGAMQWGEGWVLFPARASADERSASPRDS